MDVVALLLVALAVAATNDDIVAGQPAGAPPAHAHNTTPASARTPRWRSFLAPECLRSFRLGAHTLPAVVPCTGVHVIDPRAARQEAAAALAGQHRPGHSNTEQIYTPALTAAHTTCRSPACCHELPCSRTMQTSMLQEELGAASHTCPRWWFGACASVAAAWICVDCVRRGRFRRPGQHRCTARDCLPGPVGFCAPKTGTSTEVSRAATAEDAQLAGYRGAAVCPQRAEPCPCRHPPDWSHCFVRGLGRVHVQRLYPKRRLALVALLFAHRRIPAAHTERRFRVQSDRLLECGDVEPHPGPAPGWRRRVRGGFPRRHVARADGRTDILRPHTAGREPPSRAAELEAAGPERRGCGRARVGAVPHLPRGLP